MVVSCRTKLCLLSLFLLVFLGVGLAVVSSLVLLNQEDGEIHVLGAAEKYSQPAPHIVDSVST